MDSSDTHGPSPAESRIGIGIGAGTAPAETAVPGLGAEVRESLLLLGISAAVTAAVTLGASTALRVLG